MFNSISGIITAKLPQLIYLENNNIEWSIHIPDSSIDMLPVVGEKTKIYTWLYHKEDSMRLFGFATDKDRLLFLDLMKVNGIGPKAVLKIMSSVSTTELISILDSEDISKLEKLPGIGKKTAQKMILALRGKLSVDNSESTVTNILSAKNNGPWNEVITALVSMGYDKSLCETAIVNITNELEKDESFAKENRSKKEDIVFKRAIIELA
ncbi:MAG: Holliday junction DNA helicase RuvA [Treponema sp. CETP13]|nr:MAG: Holliday junction DNA helicase RuvA [Treponema sp. CETP13]